MSPSERPEKRKATLAEARQAMLLSELLDANRALDRISALPRYKRVDLSGNELYIRDEELRRILDKRPK